MPKYIAITLAAIASLASPGLYAQHAMPAPSATPKPAAPKMTTAQKIASAMSAAPAVISKNATIMDWPEKEGGQPKQLRAGNNGWVCFPSSPTNSAGPPATTRCASTSNGRAGAMHG